MNAQEIRDKIAALDARRAKLVAALEHAEAAEALEAGRTLSTAQLAALAGVSAAYVRRLVNAGELGSPGDKGHGGGHTIRASEARAWLRERDKR